MCVPLSCSNASSKALEGGPQVSHIPLNPITLKSHEALYHQIPKSTLNFHKSIPYPFKYLANIPKNQARASLLLCTIGWSMVYDCRTYSFVFQQSAEWHTHVGIETVTFATKGILPQNALMRDCNGKCIEWIMVHYLEVVVEV